MTYKPTEDQIQDDKNRLIGIKQDFIYAMEQVTRYVSTQSMIDSLIASEEHFNDAIQGEWNTLCQQDGDYDDLPNSVHLKKWINDQKKSIPVQCGMACQFVRVS